MTGRVRRRSFLKASGTAGAAGALASTATVAKAGVVMAAPDHDVPSFPFEEATIAELQVAMASGRLSSRRLTQAYLRRIRQIDLSGIQLNSVIEVNPDALEIAAELDAERRQGKRRGPLHGIPILVKDNFATRDRMETTAGSLALVGAEVPRDAFVVRQLRRAGAVILGKANLSEWANFRSTQSSSAGRAGPASASAPMSWTTTRAAPAPGRARRLPPTWPRPRSGPRPTGRSSARPRTTAWSGSSRPWG
jgi:amidase